MDSQTFRMIGFSEKEEKVYLSSLQLGACTANNLAKKANLPRTTTYDILKILIEKGYISYVIKSGVKYFEASSPNKLIDELKEKEKKVKELLPELNSMIGLIKEKPFVEMYEGVPGLKTMIDDIINTKQQILAISSTKDLSEKLVFYFPNYIKRRTENKISSKVITERTKETEVMKKRDKRELRQTKFLPVDKKLKNSIFIYGEKIALFNFIDPFGIIIKDATLNLSFRLIFELLWNNSKC
ncbi:hypothetical protein HYW76_01305 [Candidatus Pacearchaeota archaeon]|nr:hypothetical protein [Candidatus Pacearchaeota archaeon]